MKKETLLMKVSILVIFMFVWIFVYIMKNNEDIQPFNHLLGTWKIVATVQTEDIQIEDETTIIFDEENVFYQNKDSKKDKYVLSDNTLKAFNKKYIVDCKTEDYLRLYEDKNKYMILIKWEKDYLDEKVNEEFLNGKWNVIYKNYYHTDYQEILEFKENTLIDYRNDTKFLTSKYLFNDQYITVNELNQTYYLLPLTNNEIIFIELGTNTVWKLERMNDEEGNV